MDGRFSDDGRRKDRRKASHFADFLGDFETFSRSIATTSSAFCLRILPIAACIKIVKTPAFNGRKGAFGANNKHQTSFFFICSNAIFEWQNAPRIEQTHLGLCQVNDFLKTPQAMFRRRKRRILLLLTIKQLPKLRQMRLLPRPSPPRAGRFCGWDSFFWGFYALSSSSLILSFRWPQRRVGILPPTSSLH